MPDFIFFLIGIGVLVGVVGLAVHLSEMKKPCTCPECRPDLYQPKTPEEYAQREAMTRARGRYLEAENDLLMKEAENRDIKKLVEQMRKSPEVTNAKGH